MPQSQGVLESRCVFCSPANVKEYVTIEAGPDRKQISKHAQGLTQAAANERATRRVGGLLQELDNVCINMHRAMTPCVCLTLCDMWVELPCRLVIEVNGQMGPLNIVRDQVVWKRNDSAQDLQEGIGPMVELVRSSIHINTAAQAIDQYVSMFWHCWSLGICPFPWI